ncbi:GspH/FimT family pseudopilin [Pseudomonadales bacterium]|nr:GspH/FimT family pseudopilin [Pseudomonadales bacterium]MDB4420876.1 GspH/FimT family pseudopilin [Pseudomonadales bacterium]MDB4431423.1 GspH/FimT family pseudopilin [Pseudomonadales bacterium]
MKKQDWLDHKKSQLQSQSIARYRPTEPWLLSRDYPTGTTLIELLTTLAVIATLATFSLPALNHLVQQAQADSAQQLLRKAIYRTRSAAIFSKKIVSFCPDGEFECGEQWGNGAIIFTDDNNNGIIDEDDELLEKIDFKAANFNISWRASGRKNYLRYSPTGMARAFGRFTLCEKSKDLRLARTIVINRQGRLREYYDRNSDGIVEDIDGRKPDCR